MSFMPESDSEDELPPGWEEQATDTGYVCYVNQRSNASQWTHPRTGRSKRLGAELPYGWMRTIDKKTNRTIFHNSHTEQSTYIDPRLAFAVEDAPLDASLVRQRFDASSTAMQVLHGKELSGRLAIVTGANTGIGYETARSLVFHGCTVIFACRNKDATDRALARIAQERPAARERCSFVELDLASVQSVQNFCTKILELVKHIDFLILNASVFAMPYSQTEDGIETHFQVAHLSHFHLTLRLESLLDHNSRVVVLSSESHRFANLPVDKLTPQHLSPPRDQFWSMMAYNNAKLCNVLFVMELAKRWRHRGISVFSVHPGNMVSSNIQRHWWVYRLLFAIVRPFTKSLQQAAATTVFCATANELTGLSGYYFNNCFFCDVSSRAKNESLQQQLWTLSEKMVKDILDCPIRPRTDI